MSASTRTELREVSQMDYSANPLGGPDDTPLAKRAAHALLERCCQLLTPRPALRSPLRFLRLGEPRILLPHLRSCPRGSGIVPVAQPGDEERAVASGERLALGVLAVTRR